MEGLAHGKPMLKDLLRMSWRSLILMAVAESHEYFSAEFLEEAERPSPFRFGFLRERRKRLTGRQGLYAMLFDGVLGAARGRARRCRGLTHRRADYAFSRRFAAKAAPAAPA